MVIIRASVDWVTPRRAEVTVVTERHGECCEYGTCETPESIAASVRGHTVAAGTPHHAVLLSVFDAFNEGLWRVVTPHQIGAMMHDSVQGDSRLSEWAQGRELWGQESLDLGEL